MSDRTAPALIHEPIVQERRIVTEVAGPRSRERHARRVEVAPPGAPTALPIYNDRALAAA